MAPIASQRRLGGSRLSFVSLVFIGATFQGGSYLGIIMRIIYGEFAGRYATVKCLQLQSC